MEIKKLTLLITGAALLASCEKCEYKQTKSGLYYKIDKKGDGTVPKKGDILTVEMRYETKDSVVLFDSNTNNGTPFNMPYTETLEKEQEGSVAEAIYLLKKGDSIVCKILAKKLLGQSLEEVAKEKKIKLEETTPIYVHLHLKDIKSEKEFRKIQEENYKALLEESKKKAKEQLPNDLETIKKHLTTNKINALSTPSGLHYVIDKPGNGDLPQKGDTVVVHYTGKTLNGKVFDTSLQEIAVANQIHDDKRQYKPLIFIIGQESVLPGFEEGVQLLRKGGKARLFVPSVLAYRDMELGANIKPNSSLMFDIELKNLIKLDTNKPDGNK
jgi:FKBP-type peptidyl-prolyl cis-trans isomerase FkpA